MVPTYFRPRAWSEDYSAPLMITSAGLVNTIGRVNHRDTYCLVVNFIQNAMDELKRLIDVHERAIFRFSAGIERLSILTFLRNWTKNSPCFSNADIDRL